jgi:hypothetical protein
MARKTLEKSLRMALRNRFSNSKRDWISTKKPNSLWSEIVRFLISQIWFGHLQLLTIFTLWKLKKINNNSDKKFRSLSFRKISRISNFWRSLIGSMTISHGWIFTTQKLETFFK